MALRWQAAASRPAAAQAAALPLLACPRLVPWITKREQAAGELQSCSTEVMVGAGKEKRAGEVLL